MVRIFGFVAAAVLSLQFSALPAAAEVISLAGHTVTLEPIPGFCALDKSRTLEKQAFNIYEEILAPESQLLAFWIDCGALEAMRSNTGDGLGPYILVTASWKNDRVFETGAARRLVVERARNEIAGAYGRDEFPLNPDLQSRDKIDGTVKSFAAGVKSGSQSGTQKFMGFMGRDENGLYYATVQMKAQADAYVLASVTGMTKIRRFVISAIAYERYADPQTFLTLKDRATTAVTTLIANNPFNDSYGN